MKDKYYSIVRFFGVPITTFNASGMALNDEFPGLIAAAVTQPLCAKFAIKYIYL
tara:strand:- start:98 stop:259 length:162 start_codon:yes stop_codon:yes gene_type:complete